MDLKITSSYSVLESGKLKIVTENPDTIDTVRSLLDDNWSLLSPEDLTTSAGQAFWTFSPASLNYFVTTDSILELFKAHSGNFLEENDICYLLPPRKTRDKRCYILYPFLSYKAQLYYSHCRWSIQLIGCALKLTPYGQPRGTSPSFTRDNTPSELVVLFNKSHIEGS